MLVGMQPTLAHTNGQALLVQDFPAPSMEHIILASEMLRLSQDTAMAQALPTTQLEPHMLAAPSGDSLVTTLASGKLMLSQDTAMAQALLTTQLALHMLDAPSGASHTKGLFFFNK